MTPTTPGQPNARLPHRGRAFTLGVALPLVLLAAAVALAWSWRGRMPAEVVLHWGPSGPDRFGTFTEHLLTVLVLAAVTLLVSGTLSMTIGRSAMTRRMAVGLSAGMAAFYAGLLVATSYIQLDVTDPAAVASPGPALLLASLAALAIGAGAAAGAGADPAQPSDLHIPADAARLELPDGVAAAWIASAGFRIRWAPVLLVVVTVVPGLVIAVLTRQWWMVSLFGVLALLVAAGTTFRISVDGSGFTARSLLGWPRLHVPLAEVERADVVPISPFAEFGGWGLRTAIDGRTGVVTRKGEAIQIRRSGDRVVVATVDDAARGAALLNTLAERHQQAHRTQGGTPAG